MSLLTRPREWLDAHSDRLHAFLRFLGRRFLEDRCFDSAATLAYATLFAAVPLAAVVFGIVNGLVAARLLQELHAPGGAAVPPAAPLPER